MLPCYEHPVCVIVGSMHTASEQILVVGMAWEQGYARLQPGAIDGQAETRGSLVLNRYTTSQELEIASQEP